MWTITILEMKKLFKRTKTYVTLIAFILLVGFICYGQASEYRQIKDSRVSNAKRNIENERKELDAKDVSEIQRENIKREMNYNQAIIDGKDSVYSDDWKNEVAKEIESNKAILKGLEDNKEKNSGQPEAVRGQSITSLEQEIALKEAFIKSNIKPEGNMDIHISGIEFLNIIFRALGIIFLALGVGLFAADMVSGECTPPTLKLLLTQPISRGKVLLGKFIAVALSSIVLIIGVELSAYVIMSLIYGFGNFNVPVLVGSKYVSSSAFLYVKGSAYAITTGSLMLRMILMQILVIIAATAFAFMLSAILKSSMISMAIAMVTPVAISIIAQISTKATKVLKYFFVLFMEPKGVLTGGVMLNLSDASLTPTKVIIILVANIIVFYGIAHFVFTRKDILI